MNPRIGLRLFAAILPIVVSLGCGSGNYTPPSSTIVPTTHPLVAQYNILHSHPGLSAWVEFGPDTNYGRQTSAATSAASITDGETISILVAGMKPQTTYHMRAHANWAGGSWVDQDHTFTTGALPNSLPLPQINIQRPVPGLAPAPGIELLSMASPSATNVLDDVATDLEGNIIWYCPQNGIPIKPMQNGHFMIVTSSDLLEVDLTCNVVRDVSVAKVNQSLQAIGADFTIPPPLGVAGGDPFHHDVLVLPNGHWIGLCEIGQNFTDLTGYPGTTQVVGDCLVDIDPNDNVVWAWSSFDYLDPNRHPYFGLPDWTHSNALVYTADGNLLLSMRAQSWILKIDYANGAGSGNILWKLGVDGDFTLTGGDPGQWFYAQHYPFIVNTNGSVTTMGVYDDGNFRTDANGVACGSSATAPACYSRATLYQIDESTMLATLLWQDLPGFYSYWGGSIQTLSNGDIEFASSEPATLNPTGGPPESEILEVTQTDNPQTVWQMNIVGDWAYRGLRTPSLYPGVTWQQ